MVRHIESSILNFFNLNSNLDSTNLKTFRQKIEITRDIEKRILLDNLKDWKMERSHRCLLVFVSTLERNYKYMVECSCASIIHRSCKFPTRQRLIVTVGGLGGGEFQRVREGGRDRRETCFIDCLGQSSLRCA